MKNVLEQVAPHLLTVACYDREVLNYITSIFLFVRMDILLISFSSLTRMMMIL